MDVSVSAGGRVAICCRRAVGPASRSPTRLGLGGDRNAKAWPCLRRTPRGAEYCVIAAQAGARAPTQAPRSRGPGPSSLRGGRGLKSEGDPHASRAVLCRDAKPSKQASGFEAENAEVVRRVVDLANAAVSKWEVTITDFLSPPERADAQRTLDRMGDVAYSAFGGYKGAERVRLCIGRPEVLAAEEEKDAIAALSVTGNFMFDAASHRWVGRPLLCFFVCAVGSAPSCRARATLIAHVSTSLTLCARKF